jgi:hypothetical protein
MGPVNVQVALQLHACATLALRAVLSHLPASHFLSNCYYWKKSSGWGGGSCRSRVLVGTVTAAAAAGFTITVRPWLDPLVGTQKTVGGGAAPCSVQRAPTQKLLLCSGYFLPVFLKCQRNFGPAAYLMQAVCLVMTHEPCRRSLQPRRG